MWKRETVKFDLPVSIEKEKYPRSKVYLSNKTKCYEQSAFSRMLRLGILPT